MASDTKQAIAACLAQVDEAERTLAKCLSMHQSLSENRKALQKLLDAEEGKPSAPPAVPPAVPDNGKAAVTAETAPSAEAAAPVAQEGSKSVQESEDDIAARESQTKIQAEEQQAAVANQISNIQVDISGGAKTALEKDLLEVVDKAADELGIAREMVIKAHKVFMKYDKDGGGTICSVELYGMFQELSSETGSPVSQAAVDLILAKFDADKNGQLDFEEFIFAFCQTPGNKQRHIMRAIDRKINGVDERLGPDFRTRMVGCRADHLKSYLQKELNEESNFLRIPVILILFVCFLTSVIWHEQTAAAGSIEEAIRFDIAENANFAFVGAAPFENGRMGHKGIDDVNSFADFWSWLDLGLSPLFFPSGWGTSEQRANVGARCTPPVDALKGSGWKPPAQFSFANTPYGGDGKGLQSGTYAAITGDLGENICKFDEDTSFPEALKNLESYGNSVKTPYLFFHETVAGLRMRQEQLTEVKCPEKDLLNHVYSTQCTEENDLVWLKPNKQTAMDIETDKVNNPGGETVYFKNGLDLSTIRRHVRELENKRWVNQRTGKIELAFTVFNNHAAAFVAVYINFFINRAGHIHKIIQPITIWIDPYRQWECYIMDILFLLMVLKLLAEEGLEVIRCFKEEGAKGLKAYFQDFKNVVDWLSISYSFAVFISWAVLCTMINNLYGLLKTANVSSVGSWGNDPDIYKPSNLEYWEAVDDTARYQQDFLVLLAFYPFIIGLRFFSAFSSQPRLALVTSTLQAASKDLIHFGMVLMITLLIFCASALILFGRDIDNYENFGRTYISVFRGLLGDIDYDNLTTVGRFPASVWWLLLMVLVNCVMLNMLLAIIMDVYGSVKGAMGDDEGLYPTLWSQSYEIYRRWNEKRKGKRLGIPQIVKSLNDNNEMCYIKGTDGEKMPKRITRSLFMELVPGLSAKQADRLVANAMVSSDECSDLGFVDCVSKLRFLDLKMEQMSLMVNDLTGMNTVLREFQERNIATANATYAAVTNGAPLPAAAKSDELHWC